MIKLLFNLTSRFFIIIFGPFLLAQQINEHDIAYNELREVVETASRSQQVVWLEDFTGID